MGPVPLEGSKGGTLIADSLHVHIDILSNFSCNWNFHIFGFNRIGFWHGSINWSIGSLRNINCIGNFNFGFSFNWNLHILSFNRTVKELCSGTWFWKNLVGVLVLA